METLTLRHVAVCTACYIAQRSASAVLAARLKLERQPIDCELCVRPMLAGLTLELDAGAGDGTDEEVEVLTDALYSIARAASSPQTAIEALGHVAGKLQADQRAEAAQRAKEAEQRAAAQCRHEYSPIGPRCCLQHDHQGLHRYKCCAASCRGYPWPASEKPHSCR